MEVCTLLLKERAKYLLHNTADVVYFFVDRNCTVLFETIFGGLSHARLRMKPLSKIYRGTDRTTRKQEYASKSQLLKSLDDEDVNPEDHVIVDELFVGNIDEFINGLDVAKTKVKSLWVAIGAIDIDIVTKEALLELPGKINDIGVHCPNLRYSLRNGNLILNFSLSSSPYSDILYETLGSQLAKGTNVNKGIIKKINLKRNEIDGAIERALKEMTPRQKTLIACDSHGNLGKYKRVCCIRPQIDKKSHLNWKFSNNKEDLIEWFAAKEEEEIYLVVCTPYYPADDSESPAVTSSNAYSGIEVRSMIYITRICPKCWKSLICPNLTTRATTELIVIRLEVICNKCENK